MDFLNNQKVKLDFQLGTLEVENNILPYFKGGNSVTKKNEKNCFYQENICSKTQNMISKYEKNNPEIGNIPNIEHEIKCKEEKIISMRPLPVPYKILEKTKQELKRLMDLGIIRKSASQYSFQAFPKLKPNGDIRIIVDFRPINSITIKSGYPFPSKWNKISLFNGKTIFSQLDLNNGYYQIKV